MTRMKGCGVDVRCAIDMRIGLPANIVSGVGLGHRLMGNSLGKGTLKFSRIRLKTQCENIGLVGVEIQIDVPSFPSFCSQDGMGPTVPSTAVDGCCYSRSTALESSLAAPFRNSLNFSANSGGGLDLTPSC